MRISLHLDCTFPFLLCVWFPPWKRFHVGDWVCKQKWQIWEKSAQRCIGRPGHGLSQQGACVWWEKGGGKLWVVCHGSWEYARRWQWSPGEILPVGSRKVRVEKCPLEISATLGRAALEGWWEQTQDQAVRGESECRLKFKSRNSVSEFPRANHHCLGLFPAVLLLHFSNWCSCGKLSWDTLLYLVSCRAVSLKMWPRIGCNTPINVAKAQYA